LRDIQRLQTIEQQLLQTLESSSPPLSLEDKKQVLEKMNQLSNMRIHLYRALQSTVTHQGQQVEATSVAIKERMLATHIVETALNESKRKLTDMQVDEENQLRQVEINVYYEQQYHDQQNMMKYIAYTFLSVFVLTYVYNHISIFPTPLYYALILLSSLLGAYYVGMLYLYMIQRDNMHYQETTWGPPNLPTTTTYSSSSSSTTNPSPWSSANNTTPGPLCVGSACCSSTQYWDASINKCTN
jgi:hypothetical protein